MSCLDAGVFIALACEGRWRCEGSQNGLPSRRRVHCAGVSGTLACEGRWRWEELRIGYPDAGVSIALACLLRRRVRDAGVRKGARTGFTDAGVFIALAYWSRRRSPDAGVGKGSQN
jgi:hypothetical protein